MSRQPNHAVAANQPVRITIYRWAGKWGPFKVKIPCGECALTSDVVKDTMETELAGVQVELEVLDWLSNWWKPIIKGGWHAPIVMVDGEIIAQGHALNRGVLAEAVVSAWVQRSQVAGTHLYGKESCPHCVRAKQAFADSGIAYTHHDVVKNPRALYEMIQRVKPIVGPKTPITVPQIWVDGRYVGGADQLEALLGSAVAERAPEPAMAQPVASLDDQIVPAAA